jgi:hypothetical protein
MAMEEHHKHILVRNRVFLVKHLKCHRDILTYLRQQRILTEDMAEEIMVSLMFCPCNVYISTLCCVSVFHTRVRFKLIFTVNDVV